MQRMETVLRRMAVAVCLLYVVLLTACGARVTEAEKVMSAVLVCARQQDYTAMQEYLDGTVYGGYAAQLPKEELQEAVQPFFEHLRCELEGVAEQGKEKTVLTVCTTSPDTEQMAEHFWSRYQTEGSGDSLALLRSVLSEQGLALIKTVREITVIKQDGRWRVVADENLEDVLSGGLASAIRKRMG